MAGRGVEQNAKLQTLPVTHNTGPDPEPADHLRTFRDQANRCDQSNGAASCLPIGNKRQEDIEGKKPSPIFNTIWCYFPLSVMPLLLQIGLAVKGIDCEPQPQLGQKRGKQRWRVWAVTSR